ncbi:MAG: CHAT domain-containing tetratricopeptide repeat protein, partial [Bacteroidota bacterium]
ALLVGKPQAALSYLEEAKALYEEKYSFQQAEITKILRQIGQIHQKTGKIKDAILVYQEGLKILQREEESIALASPYRHPIEAYGLLMALGEAYAENQEAEAALEHYQKAADLVQFIRSSFYNLEAKYFWSEGRFASVFRSILRLCEQEYQRTHERRYFEQAFLAAEANKAFSLYENQQKQLARIQTHLPDTVWREGQKIEREIEFYQQKLWAAEAKGKSQNTNYKEKLFSWQQARDRWQANLQTKYPDYYQKTLAAIDLLSVDSLQQQLAPSSLLLEYFRAGTSYYRFSISQESLAFTQLGVDAKSLETQLDSIYQVLFVQEPSLDALSPFASLSSELYQHLLGESLEDSRFAELIVIADGQIGYLPFEILTKNTVKTEPESSVRQWREYPYLLHDYAIQYAYSASLLFKSKAKTAQHYRSKWLGVAPKYESKLALMHNLTEVKALAKQTNGKVLTGDQAQKENFIQQASDFQILHLAMHGFVDPNDPAQAHLAFANNPDEALYAWEIPYLHLQTDLVILSACESGYGKFQTGEGVMSLARAFSQAGCKSVINTLWTVDDAASQKINELMYPNLLEGNNKAVALQKAKMTYIAEAPPHAVHPHYWAAFVLTGSDSPLSTQASHGYLWLGLALVSLGLFWLLGRSWLARH